MYDVKFWKLSDVLAKISVANFTLRKATAVSAEWWDNFQHLMQVIAVNQNCNLFSSCRNLTTWSITCCYKFQITVTCIIAVATLKTYSNWDLFFMMGNYGRDVQWYVWLIFSVTCSQSRILVKRIVALLVMKYPPLMEPKGSFPCWEQPTSNRSQNPVEYSVHFHTEFMIHFLYYPAIHASPVKWVFCFRFSELNSLFICHLSHAYYLPHPTKTPCFVQTWRRVCSTMLHIIHFSIQESLLLS
jgi:heme exporter protein D